MVIIMGKNEGSGVCPESVFTQNRRALVVDGDEYRIVDCDYVDSVVSGLRWSDEDYWRRDEEELHTMVHTVL